MKKISVIALLLVSLLGLSGCGNQQTNKQPQKDSSTVAGKSKESTVKSDTATSKSDASVEQSKSEKNQESTRKDNTSTEASKVSPDPQAPEADHTVRTESGSTTDIGQARIALYEAGIDSHSMTDDDILTVWERSKDKEEFVKNVKEYLGQ